MLKIFSGIKRSDSYVLNLLGIQVFRIIAYKIKVFISHLIFNGINTSDRNELSMYGIMQISDIFPDFDLLNKKRKEFILDSRLNSFHLLGADYKELIFDDEVIADYQLVEIFDDFYAKIIPILSKSLKRNILKKMINISFQSIEMDPDVVDKQNEWHADCFYDTFKGFVFFDDVKSDGAPFTYLCGSNKIGMQRLIDEYRNSLRFDLDASTRFNINPDDKNILELKVKKNCLIIANTCGVHKRKAITKSITRQCIYFFVRPNPFKPW